MSLLDTADAGMIAEQVRTARISPAEVAEHFLAQTHAREADIQAFVSLDPAALRTQVAQLKGPALNGLLAGVPVGDKAACGSIKGGNKAKNNSRTFGFNPLK